MKKRIISALLALAACNKPKSFTFIQLTDTQIGFIDTTTHYVLSDSLLGLAVEAVNRIHPASVVVTGDLVNDMNQAEQVEIYRRRMAGIDPSIPVWVVPGNHDERPYTEKNHARYMDFIGYDRFSFVLNGVAFIGINSNVIRDGIADAEAEQLEWLKTELARAQKADKRFVFLHCPIFRRTLDEPEDYSNFQIPKRKEYLELFRQYGVDAVFSGHLHYGLETEYEGIRLITSGPVARPLGNGISGICVVNVDPEGFDYRFTPAPEATAAF